MLALSRKKILFEITEVGGDEMKISKWKVIAQLKLPQKAFIKNHKTSSKSTNSTRNTNQPECYFGVDQC